MAKATYMYWQKRFNRENPDQGEPAGQVKWFFSCPAGFTLKEMQGDGIIGASNQNW